jgi:hypothetical protein
MVETWRHRRDPRPNRSGDDGSSAAAARVVEAQKFVLKDVKGKVRAVLGPEELPGRHVPLLEPGLYGLYFYDSEGAYRAGLAEASSDQWELELHAKKSPTSAILTVRDGLAWLLLRATLQSHEAAERDRAEWRKQFDAAQTPEAREKLSRGLPFNGIEAQLQALGVEKVSSRLGITHGLGGGFEFILENQQPSLYLSDPKGIMRAVVGHTKLERQATGVTEERPPSSIVLFNKDGGVLWKAP